MRTHDITRPVFEGMPVWPGDTPYRFRLVGSIRGGDAVNVGSIAASIHSGTHVDAPFHFDDGAATVDALSLDPFLGPARVVDVRGRPTIRREDLAPYDLSATPRLLLRTDGWADPARVPERIPVLADDVPDDLRARGVILIGVDVPSVDAIDSKDLPIHHALGSAGIAILESVDLSEVPFGTYELVAIPLKLIGTDGSPVRAILRG